MDQTVERYLQDHAGEAQQILEQLCRQPAIAAQRVGITEMADMTEQLLRDAGFQTRQLHTEDAPPVVYGEQRGRSPYTLLLYDHYDVQPADPLELWQTPPFEPTVRDGNLYARGTSDDKGEIAARLAAIRALRAVYGELPINIRWVIEGEEEIGSPHFGAIAAAHADLLRADGCLWEGTGFDDDERPEMFLGTKGLLYVQLDVQGADSDAHSMAAPIVTSAAWRLVQALASLRTGDGRVRLPAFYDAVRAPTEQQRAIMEDQPAPDAIYRQMYRVEQFLDQLSGPILRERMSFAPTCNIAGLLSGYTGEGVKTVLPARAMAKVDFRLVPDQDPHAILASLRAHLDAEGFDDVRITCLGAAAPTVSSMDHPFVQHIIAITESFNGRRPAITPLLGGTLPLLDALQRHVGVPGVAAPGNPMYWGSGLHAPNEHIRLLDLERAVRFNCHLFQSLGK